MNSAAVKTVLEEAMEIDGALGACLVDYRSGMTLGTAGGSAALNLEVAAAGTTEVVKAQMKVMNQLGIRDKIEDILITIGTQLHLIRLVNAQTNMFLYVALNRPQANLGMARLQLQDAESKLS